MKLLGAALLPCILAASFDLPDLEVEETGDIMLYTYGLEDELFEEFKKVFSKEYASVREEELRRSIFEESLNLITMHNQKYIAGEETYFLAVNQFADLTNEEFRQIYTGKVTDVEEFPTATPSNDLDPKTDPTKPPLPYIIDWRNTGFLSPVKSQGKCASGWAFSVAGALEGQHFNMTREQVSLSAQQLLDCIMYVGACEGGDILKTYSYLMLVRGMESDADYPYIAKSANCMFDKHKIASNVTGFMEVTVNNEYDLMSTLYNIGPASILINAGLHTFQLYGGGIYKDRNCDPMQVNHAALAAGYGSKPSHYWIIKNSWGTTWGEEGFMRIARDKDNLCGVTLQPTLPFA